LPTATRHHRDTERVPISEASSKSCSVPRGYVHRGAGAREPHTLTSVRAVQITRLGGPEVLDVIDLPDPTPSEGQELFEVSSAGVNFADTHHRLASD
jgi:hypothetical protein